MYHEIPVPWCSNRHGCHPTPNVRLPYPFHARDALGKRKVARDRGILIRDEVSLVANGYRRGEPAFILRANGLIGALLNTPGRKDWLHVVHAGASESVISKPPERIWAILRPSVHNSNFRYLIPDRLLVTGSDGTSRCDSKPGEVCLSRCSRLKTCRSRRI